VGEHEVGAGTHEAAVSDSHGEPVEELVGGSEIVPETGIVTLERGVVDLEDGERAPRSAADPHRRSVAQSEVSLERLLATDRDRKFQPLRWRVRRSDVRLAPPLCEEQEGRSAEPRPVKALHEEGVEGVDRIGAVLHLAVALDVLGLGRRRKQENEQGENRAHGFTSPWLRCATLARLKERIVILTVYNSIVSVYCQS